MLGAALLLIACGSSVQRLPPGKPPTPKSVTRADPGGDAHDPHLAALTRLLKAPWGRRNDKDNQLHVPTPDWKNWKRVRYWGVEHFVGFRYGDDHHAIAVAFVIDVKEDEPLDSASCIARFEKSGRQRAKSYSVELSPISTHYTQWEGHPVVVKYVDAYIDMGMSRNFYSGAYAAYPAYTDACLVYAVAVPWRDQEDTARAVRDRFVDEGFNQMFPKTETRPYRKE